MTNRENRHWIPVRSERVWAWTALALAAAIVLWGCWSLYQYPASYHTRDFKFTFKNEGSLARIAIFAVLAHYAILFLFQKGLVDRWNTAKKWMIAASRLVRRWHTPAAIIALALIVLHAIGAVLYGLELNFENVSGLLALLVLLPVPISGLFRYRRLDKKWHLRTGLAFAILFLLHAFL